MSVVVVGSANLDFVYHVDRIPAPGETLLAARSAQYPGGKGNNQAIAAARAGAQTSFIGSLGNDASAAILRRELKLATVKAHLRTQDGPTGTALVTLDGAGTNTIIVNAGANGDFADLTSAELDAIRIADVLLMQLEIPMETVLDAARAGHEAGCTVILNAAPVRELPAQLLPELDVLIVNEHEALILAGLADTTVRSAPNHAALELLRSVPAVVVTLGENGLLVARRGAETVHLPAFAARAIDTTGAGDTFCGAFAAALSEGTDVLHAARFAACAAALSVQREGAVPSIPDRAEIESHLHRHESTD
ncbi:ribokinase [Arthrobacter pigmenti]|uniref:Ribokinase n=1 Tax=Arthrobacter pigmenti TaxID=271432 RepID=A0A846RSP7_9MICC|nr:ribokinase [Arthrobacter pigmenti]